jgi:hypothetical protein
MGEQRKPLAEKYILKALRNDDATKDPKKRTAALVYAIKYGYAEVLSELFFEKELSKLERSCVVAGLALTTDEHEYAEKVLSPYFSDAQNANKFRFHPNNMFFIAAAIFLTAKSRQTNKSLVRFLNKSKSEIISLLPFDDNKSPLRSSTPCATALIGTSTSGRGIRCLTR